MNNDDTSHLLGLDTQPHHHHHQQQHGTPSSTSAAEQAFAIDPALGGGTQPGSTRQTPSSQSQQQQSQSQQVGNAPQSSSASPGGGATGGRVQGPVVLDASSHLGPGASPGLGLSDGQQQNQHLQAHQMHHLHHLQHTPQHHLHYDPSEYADVQRVAQAVQQAAQQQRGELEGLHMGVPPPHSPALMGHEPHQQPSHGGGPSSSSQQSKGNRRKSSMGGGQEETEDELKKTAEQYLSVSIDELANKVRFDDSLPSAEKTRQIFGMNWLMRSCEVSPEAAVPRNRIYARYVGVCAGLQIKPLNPASFGKLVRLVYPDIKTRRLGVRGQSKYHYCGIKLIEDGVGSNSGNMALSASPFTSPPGSQRFDFGSSVPGPTDEHVKSDEDDMMHQGNGHQQQDASSSQQRLLPQQPYESLRPQLSDAYSASESVDLNSGGAAGGGVSSGPNQGPSTECLLPDMAPYLPQGADRDAAATLAGLYQAYCHSLAESIRFMRLKQFNLTCLSFYRSLTVPVQRVLAYPSLQIWIQKADWIMYKVIVRLLSQLALSVVPPVILSAVRSLAITLGETVHQGFMMVSEELVRSKMVPARAFIALVLRLLRVNETAHAAGKILAHDSDRELMKSDWQKFVNARQVVQQDIPCGSSKVERILSEGVIDLLTLPPPPPDRENREGGDDGGEEVSRGNGSSGRGGDNSSGGGGGGGNATGRSGSRGGAVNSTSEDIIERWAVYLEMLPRQFSNVSKRLFLLCASTVVTSALREITLSGGAAFGAWWVVRCWIDEWLSWTAERDGFMATSYVSPEDGNFDILNSGSRLKGLEMEVVGKSEHQQSTVTVKQQQQQQQQQQSPGQEPSISHTGGSESGKRSGGGKIEGSNQEEGGVIHGQTSGESSSRGGSEGGEGGERGSGQDGGRQGQEPGGDDGDEEDDDEMQPTEETDPELIRKIIETLPSG